MSIELWTFTLIGLIAVALSSGLTLFFRALALKMNALDRPNESHKTHVEPTPYLGGVAIAASTSIVFIFALNEYFWSGEVQTILLSLVIPAILLSLVGLLDDLFNLSALRRFLAQSILGTCVALSISTNGLNGMPSGIHLLDVFITAIWIVTICNSINFFDNVDGGAAGASAIILLGIFTIAVIGDQELVALAAIVCCGSVIGFLHWNRSPARIYMGDAGSLFLGMMLSVLSIRIDPQVASFGLSLCVPLLLFATPLLDTSVAVISRICGAMSPFQGGRDHLSHRIINRGIKKTMAVYILWALNLIFVLAALWLALGLAGSRVVVAGSFVLWLLLFVLFYRMKAPN